MARIFILGGGAVGAPLAAFLTDAGRPVTLLRFHGDTRGPRHGRIRVRCDSGVRDVPVDERLFSEVEALDGGWVVVAAKAHANERIARELVRRSFEGPIVLLQNGLGVERPFLEAGFAGVLRAVLYLTSERTEEREFALRVPRESPLGVIAGPDDLLEKAMRVLQTPELPFVAEPEIHRFVWRKTIINAVFNSICTLLEQDNGLFHRIEAAMSMARQVVGECTHLAREKGVDLEVEQIMEDVRMISGRSNQLISTLQDFKAGRQTEMDYINLELARIAESESPPMDLTLTAALGKLVEIKIALRTAADPA